MGFSRSGIAGSRKLSGNGIPILVAAPCTSWANGGPHAAQENFFRTRFAPRDDPAK